MWFKDKKEAGAFNEERTVEGFTQWLLKNEELAM